jgi:signal peptidase I
MSYATLKKSYKPMTLRIALLLISSIFLMTNSSCQNDVKAFKNSSIANEPTLKINSKILISTLKNPSNNDFVAYNYEDKILGKDLRIHKLVAKENDILEIIDGVVFVNKINVDKGKNLIHFYKIPTSDYLNIKRIENISDQFYAFPSGKDSVNALLEHIIAKKYNWESAKLIKKSGIADNTIKKMYGKNWNEDNFGPLLIPKSKIFVIGENRHNSEDSRYIGLIDISQIFGVVIEKE